jgi:drug/metabolite transporter (DMT)-like permease
MTKLKLSPRLQAILLAIFVTVLWSSSWVLIKLGLRNELSPITFAGMRYTLAFLFLLPLVMKNKAARNAIKLLSPKEWGKLVALGIIFYSLTQGSMFLALAYLPANTLSLLLNMSSIFVGIAGIFFLKEYPSLLQWLGLGLASLGVGVYFFPISLPPALLIGLGIGLFCMAANVTSSLFSRAVNRSAELPPLVVTFIPMGFGAIIMLVIGLLLEGVGRLSVQDWSIIIWLALVNSALAFWLWNRSLQVLTAVESSIINSLMMPQIALLAFFFLGEAMGVKEIIGLICVALGTLIVQLRTRKNM